MVPTWKHITHTHQFSSQCSQCSLFHLSGSTRPCINCILDFTINTLGWTGCLVKLESRAWFRVGKVSPVLSSYSATIPNLSLILNRCCLWHKYCLSHAMAFLTLSIKHMHFIPHSKHCNEPSLSGVTSSLTEQSFALLSISLSPTENCLLQDLCRMHLDRNIYWKIPLKTQIFGFAQTAQFHAVLSLSVIGRNKQVVF